MNQHGKQSQKESTRAGSWWARLRKRLTLRRTSEERLPETRRVDQYERVPVRHTKQVHCQHSRLAKLYATLSGHLFRRMVCRSSIEDICPICGLLPKGHRRVKQVLRVWFEDGEALEYHFLNRAWDECYKTVDGSLRIFLDDSTLTYSMDSITVIDFGPVEVPPDPPEVVEAERIIAGHASLD